MFAYMLFGADSESVLLPLFWLTVIIVTTVVVLGAILGGIWLWARWHWIVRPAAEHPLHELNKAEIKAVEQALSEATNEDEAMRLRAVLLSAQGYGVHEIMHLTDADRQDIESWLALYEEKGLAVLRNRHLRTETSTTGSSLPSDMVPA